jgi:hypothetical protein
VEDYRYVPAEALGGSVLRRQRLEKLYLVANYMTIDPVARKAERQRREQRLLEEKWRREREQTKGIAG